MTGPENTGAKRATGRRGAIATSAPAASRIGVAVLAGGGNAVDAAVAAALALAVADPANAGLGGRCHLVVATPEGGVRALDGATRQPAATPPDPRPAARGHATAPVPGLLAALDAALAAYGRLSWADAVRPAAALATDGFLVPPGLAAAWAEAAPDLARDADARRHYLDDDGRPPAAGARVRLPVLAELLDRLAAEGAAGFYRGPVAADLAAENRAGGGALAAADLAAYRARPGEVVRGPFRGRVVATVGRQAWGHTLIEMLGLIERLEGAASGEADRAARRALALHAALDDRPHEIGTLRPKRDGLALDRLIAADFLDARAAEVEALLASSPEVLAARLTAALPWPESHTTDEMDKGFFSRGSLSLARTTSWRSAAHRLEASPGRLIRALPA